MLITVDYLKAIKQAELAALLGISDRRIQQLHGEGLPRSGSGRGCTYDWGQILPWHIGRISGSSSGADARLTHRERLNKAKADDAELDLAVKLGQLLPSEKVREQWAEECAAMRARLLSIPSTAALKIDGDMDQAQREGIIRKEIFEALEMLSGGKND